MSKFEPVYQAAEKWADRLDRSGQSAMRTAGRILRDRLVELRATVDLLEGTTRTNSREESTVDAVDDFLRWRKLDDECRDGVTDLIVKGFARRKAEAERVRRGREHAKEEGRLRDDE